MLASDGNGLATTLGSRGALRWRGPLAAALFSLALVFCLFGAVATSRAAAPDSAAQVSLARLALLQAEITASDSAARSYFGSSVAICGETAVIGAPGDDAGEEEGAGAAYIFVRSGGVWTQEAKLTVGDPSAGDELGSQVALSGDTALIGAWRHATAGNEAAGAAYVFARSGGVWTQEAELTADVPDSFDWFGAGVALSGDTALIGAPNRDVAGKVWAGAAYVFARSGGVWTQEAELTADISADYDNFGTSVAVYGDTALIAAAVGSAYVFVRSGDVWTQQQELRAGDGASVALSGETALIGDVVERRFAGAVYVFVRSGDVWTRHQKLTAADGAAEDYFGSSVAIDGDTALIGGQSVRTCVFERVTGVWVRRQTLRACNSVALAGDSALLGGERRTVAGKVNAGAAYVFLLDHVPQTKPTIAGMRPESGKRGAFVAIRGTEFGATRGTGSVQFGGKTCTAYASWSAGQIRCRVPATAKYGAAQVMVKTLAGKSNAMRFRVRR